MEITQLSCDECGKEVEAWAILESVVELDNSIPILCSQMCAESYMEDYDDT